MMGGASEEENVDAVKVVLQFWTNLEDVAASIRKLQQDDFVPEVDEYICGRTGVSYGGFADSAYLRDTASGETGADLEHILIWLMREHRDPEQASRETSITSVVQGKRLVTPYLRDREICGRATMGKDLDNAIAISLAISGASNRNIAGVEGEDMGTHLNEAKEAGDITPWEELVTVAKAYDAKLSGRATQARRTASYSADERTSLTTGSVGAVQQVGYPQEQHLEVVGAVQGANRSAVPSGMEEYHQQFMVPLIARVDQCDDNISGIRKDVGTMKTEIMMGMGDMFSEMKKSMAQ